MPLRLALAELKHPGILYRLPGRCSVIYSIFLNVQLDSLIQCLRYIFPVLLPLLHAFRQKIFDLTVNGTEIIFGPGGKLGIELGGDPQGNLFLFFCHL